jgi:hypothetical protein
LINKKITAGHFLIVTSVVSGLAVATKVSSLIFMLIPALVIVSVGRENMVRASAYLVLYGLLAAIIGVIFSPHNLISFNEFQAALRYESEVALGQTAVFYTRQFRATIPILFQFMKIFPYALGLPLLLLFLLGLFALPMSLNYNLLRAAFLLYFIPNAFLYAKWTRFMMPVIPLMLIIATLFILFLLNKIKSTSRYLEVSVAAFLVLLVVVPGVAYLSIYQRPDVRLSVSSWINRNVPPGSFILSETANVVDIPVDSLHKYQHVSFNFYDLDQEAQLQDQLESHLSDADYIFVPSRRIFANHQSENYPLLNAYYAKLFSGQLGFEEVAKFSSYPSLSLLGKTLLEFPDEQAEETWTVFDHPVVRIYRKSL